MTRQAHLDPSAFHLEGGTTGILLIHGFTGSPPAMRRVGEYLHGRGLTVSAPLLPGHGTSVERMNRCRWSDWTEHVDRALADLRSRCQTVFVAGLSMGSVLTLYLAAHHDLPGAILYSPGVKVANRLIHLTPLLKYVIPRVAKSSESDYTDPEAERYAWSYEEYPAYAAHEFLKLIRRVQRLLPQVTCPLFIIHSTGDHAIAPNSAEYTYAHVGSPDKELVTLRNSGHNITVDSEWETVAEKTYAFIRAHLPQED
ncbi:MAG: alpha/beta fold hydrolase [Anaerolineae bacterium]|jgi:carboxylesterase